MPDPPRDRSHPAPRHSAPPPPIATPSRHAPTPPLQTSSPPTSTSRRREYFPDRTPIARKTPAMARTSPPLPRAPTALMPRHLHDTPKRARHRLVLRLPHYSPQDEASESTQFRRNTGHLARRAWDGRHDLLSLLFLRFILPDSAVEHVLIFITKPCNQNPPRILRNEPRTNEDDDGDADDGCHDAGLDARDLNAAAAYPFPPSPADRLRAPLRPQAHMTDACFEAWLSTRSLPTASPTAFITAWNANGESLAVTAPPPQLNTRPPHELR